MKIIYSILTLFCVAFTPLVVAAQDQDTTTITLDDIQFDVESVYLKKDTAVINLFVISATATDREFKMNTFASTVADRSYNDHFYSEIKMGRIRIRLEDKTNYLHYLLPSDTPVSLQFKVAAWPEKTGIPESVKIVFEDSNEKGRFRELNIYMPKEKK